MNSSLNTAVEGGDAKSVEILKARYDLREKERQTFILTDTKAA